MENFFSKFDENQKFNLFIGDYFNSSDNVSVKSIMMDEVFYSLPKSYQNYIKPKLSLSRVTQLYLDLALSGRKNLIKLLKTKIPAEQLEEKDIYGKFIDSDLFATFITFNYSLVINSLQYENIKKISPMSFISSKISSSKLKCYTVFGEMERDDFILTHQDIKRLKTLDVYKEFWVEIRKEFSLRPTIFLGLDFQNIDNLDILDFILDSVSDLQPMYLITSDTLLDRNATRFINKYNIKLSTITEKKFISFLSNLKKPKNSFIEKVVDVEKKLVW